MSSMPRSVLLLLLLQSSCLLVCVCCWQCLQFIHLPRFLLAHHTDTVLGVLCLSSTPRSLHLLLHSQSRCLLVWLFHDFILQSKQMPIVLRFSHGRASCLIGTWFFSALHSCSKGKDSACCSSCFAFCSLVFSIFLFCDAALCFGFVRCRSFLRSFAAFSLDQFIEMTWC